MLLLDWSKYYGNKIVLNKQGFNILCLLHTCLGPGKITLSIKCISETLFSDTDEEYELIKSKLNEFETMLETDLEDVEGEAYLVYNMFLCMLIS